MPDSQVDQVSSHCIDSNEEGTSPLLHIIAHMNQVRIK